MRSEVKMALLSRISQEVILSKRNSVVHWLTVREAWFPYQAWQYARKKLTILRSMATVWEAQFRIAHHIRSSQSVWTRFIAISGYTGTPCEEHDIRSCIAVRR